MRKTISKLIKIWAIVLVVFLFAGCSGYYGECRHKAIYAAFVMQEKYKTKIVLVEGRHVLETHAQCRAFIGNKWEWIQVVGEKIYIGRQEYGIGKDNFVEYAPIEFVRWMDTYKVIQ